MAFSLAVCSKTGTYVRMLCTFPEMGLVCIRHKRQVPQLDAIIRLITHSKPFIFQEFGISKERLLLRRRQNTQSLPSFFFTVINTGIQQVSRIAMTFEGPTRSQPEYIL